MLCRHHITPQSNVQVYDTRGSSPCCAPNHLTICSSVLQILISWLQGHHAQLKDIPLLERMRVSAQSIQRSSPAPTIIASASKLTSLIETQVSYSVGKG